MLYVFKESEAFHVLIGRSYQGITAAKSGIYTQGQSLLLQATHLAANGVEIVEISEAKHGGIRLLRATSACLGQARKGLVPVEAIEVDQLIHSVLGPSQVELLLVSRIKGLAEP